MKKIIFTTLFVLLVLSGCRTADSAPKPEAPKVLDQNDSSITAGKMLAEQYMTHFLSAIQKDDFSLLQPALPEKVSDRDQRSYFAGQMKWIKEKLGALKKAEYLGVFRKGALCEYLWKLTFENHAGDQIVEIDLPYIVRTVRDEHGEVKIMMVGFVIR